MSRLRRLYEGLVTAPSFVWLTLLFLIPTLIVFAIVFKPADPYGGIGSGWTLETLRSLGNPNYPAIIWRTLWLSLLTTAFCLLLALPTGYYMARVDKKWHNTLLLLVITPFMTSFLVRIFAWKTLLHPEGLIKQALVFLGLVHPDATLLYTPEAVLLVMVYTELPFAILPIFTAAEKFDYHLVEAARDLGAGPLTAFFRIFVPGISRAIATAVLVVLIPALGSYVIPDVVGGPNSEMIGNKIAQRAFADRNLPHASGLAAILTLTVLLPLVVSLIMQTRSAEKHPPILQEKA
ncbi:MAG TPA: ABC transporter permease [bacterium]|nr:ABC transporter permease [bacterium]HPR87060.1 ABC transporter permease [bacterium]